MRVDWILSVGGVTSSNEMAERDRAINYGGIGAIHLMGQRLGLAQEIDSRLQLLKRHLPYHESDHVLNLAYNAHLDGPASGRYRVAPQ